MMPDDRTVEAEVEEGRTRRHEGAILSLTRSDGAEDRGDQDESSEAQSSSSSSLSKKKPPSSLSSEKISANKPRSHDVLKEKETKLASAPTETSTQRAGYRQQLVDDLLCQSDHGPLKSAPNRHATPDDRISSYTAVVAAAPPDLQRTEGRPNVANTTPGAIRIQPSEGGAIMELPALVALQSTRVFPSINDQGLQSSDEQAAQQQGIATGGANSAPMFQATLVEESENGDADENKNNNNRDDHKPAPGDDAQSRNAEENAMQRILADAVVADVAHVERKSSSSRNRDLLYLAFAIVCVVVIAASVTAGVVLSRSSQAAAPETAAPTTLPPTASPVSSQDSTDEPETPDA
eukprot:CAMPEP_0119560072 /NCGR_PEP_ID=MMETSP1352-20130426/13929_1 /TAXON_ID=265584 /ORGANISM="Stauroneis constricta, Strain CCMP1120" /LENGTH=349 /DNA_ID=CAMNT_0007607957 /DNA_START=101 /DNA_END=1153 /DNA_ORIENTATION=+